MNTSGIVTKRLKLKLKKYIIILAMLLVTLNGMIPASLPVYAAEKTGMEELEQPNISKDVDGQESKEIQKGTDYLYNVNVQLPENLSGYETMTVSDDLDKRLTVQKTAVLVNGEVDDALKAVVEGQKVTFEVKQEQLQALAGKEVKLQITTQVQEEATTAEKINNIAIITINGNVMTETNPAVVTPIDAESEDTESEDAKSEDAKSDSKEESVEESAIEDKTQEKKIEAKEQAKKDDSKASTVESNTKNIAIANNKAMAADTDNQWLTHKFDGFSSDTFDQWFAKNGAAEITAGSNFIRLTPAVAEQSGSVFCKSGVCSNNNYSFSTAFSFQMGNQSSEGASDGLTFTIATETSYADAVGGGLGYYGINPSFAIKYDTFLNEVYKDPSANYIGLAKNGTVVNQDGWFTDLDQYNTDSGANFVLSDGTMYYTWIDYDGLSRNIQVRLGTSPDRVSSEVVLDVNDIDLGSIFGGQAIHAGFTASTGYPNYENHDIHSWYFVNDFAPISTLNPQNDYKLAPSSVELTTPSSVKPGEYNVTATLLDPLGNPVKGASLDNLATTSGELTGPNGEAINELVSDAEGKIHFVLKNRDYSKDTTITATVGCDKATETIPASDEPPVDPPDVCAAPVALINGSFEEPVVIGSEFSRDAGSRTYYAIFPEDIVPGWKTTASDKAIEIWDESFLKHPNKPLVDRVPDGKQVAELNANEVGALYQDVETTPGQTIYWRLYHQGKYGTDTMDVRIGSADVHPDQLQVVESLATGPTEWKQYSGTYTVPAGQTMTRFAFVSTTETATPHHGNVLDDIFLGTEPCVTAEKSVSPEGDVFEGDELTYEVTVKNSGGDIAANTIIEDAIPEGTEYVPGSMKILSGPNEGDISDEDDDDAGHYADGKVIFNVGDLPNTNDLADGITIQFKVKTLSSHVGETVVNKAQVSYKNLLKDADEKSIETNEVTSNVIDRPDPPNVCTAPVALINGSFEEPVNDRIPWLSYPGVAPHGFWGYWYSKDVPGWETTASDSAMQIHRYEQFTHPVAGLTAAHGNQIVELNAQEPSMLYQDVDTTPGQKIYWRVSHLGYMGTNPGVGEDEMHIKIGAPGSELNIEGTAITSNTAWKHYSGEYVVPAGQTKTRFGFEAVRSASGSQVAGNIIDNVFLGTEACVTAEKTVSPEGDVYAGDELTYEVTVKNGGGDIAADTIIEDVIPEGTEYVPGSMKILSGPNEGDISDEDDDDAGHYADGKVIFNVGDLPNTTNLPNGITIQFKVKALSDHAGQDVVNKAQVKYKDLLKKEDKETETNETKTLIKYKAPVLKSEKSATLKGKAERNTDQDNPEVGDTLLYTIRSQNTVKDSIVKNLVISDELPEGLEYVKDSLKVDGESVTDAQDDDNGHAVEGKLSGQFGNITDTEWHTITFEVKIKPGQAGTDIKNIATVGGDNTDTPDKPEEEVKVYPREPKLEAEKSAENAEQGKEKYEVGDTIVYTIKARNTVSDSLVENLTITDELPEGLEYIADSLKVSEGGQGEFKDGNITASFGDVRDTEWRTVTFEAKVVSGQSGKEIENTAAVDGENIDTPDEPSTKIKVDPKDPKLESKKSAQLEQKAEGNTDAEHPEVGDTIRYTITTKNTIEDSLVKNLVISDTIPEGVTYVANSLKVNSQKVTDADHIVDRKITVNFGDVTDTKVRTVTFLVTIDEGQASADIQNIATVEGDNTDTPDKPEEEVKVYPRIPKLESEKTAVNAEKGKEKYEVGDTIVYTIKARNTVSDSLVENLTITDKLPSGLEYIADSLKVSEGGKGEFKDGTITASFGDVTDTEWHTVTFEAKVISGQSGKEIENIATVGGDNIDTPDKPSEKVTVDPKAPKLESKKSAENAEKGKEKYEVGDTIVYTIETRNTVSDSLVKNLTITDELPEGLEYIADSLKVSEGGKGEFKDENITATFGDVTDTEWHTVTFEAKVVSGQSGKEIENIATVGGDNIDTPDKPSEKVTVDPKAPKLESEKTAVNAEKGKEKYEVGDTIVYTIKVRNTVSDSLVENLTITDKLPSGLEYIADSLKVSEGGKGEFKDGNITASFGDVTDTEWHTVTLEAEVISGQSGKEIENIATVGGDNIDTPDKPSEKVTVDPKAPKLESEKTAVNAEKGKEKYEVGDTIVYTIKARNTVSDSLVKNLTITDALPAGLEYVDGSLEVSHEGKGEFKDGKITATFGDVKDTEWRTVTFEAKIKTGQSGKEIENIATVGGDNVDEPDKPKEKVTVDPKDPVLKSEKSAKLEAKAEGNKDKDHPEVGDTLLYTIKTQNTIEDSLVKNLVISDDIPEGLEYVTGSLKVDGESVTDAKDKDKGHAVDGSIAAQFGDIKDTNWHTVEFLVIVKSGQAGKDIKNVAVVEGDNIDTPDKPEEVVQVYPRNSALESEKLAANMEKGKEKFEVGDTVIYTIKARNRESDSLVENLTIVDKLPAGLEYVDGSLEVSHKGSGEFKDGSIIANFGDVMDTEWRTVTFKAKIQPDQFGENIKNIAEVSGNNVPNSNHPEAEFKVELKKPEPTPEEPKDPKDPRDPAPTPDKNDDPGVETSSSDKDKEAGKKLPNTATNIFNYGLVGIFAILAGLLALRRRKSKDN